MLFVPFVFSKSRFQGPAFRCDKVVIMVTLLEAIEGIPDQNITIGERKTPTIFTRDFFMSEDLRMDIQRDVFTIAVESEPFIDNQSEHISKLSLHQSLVKRKFIHCDF